MPKVFKFYIIFTHSHRWIDLKIFRVLYIYLNELFYQHVAEKIPSSSLNEFRIVKCGIAVVKNFVLIEISVDKVGI